MFLLIACSLATYTMITLTLRTSQYPNVALSHVDVDNQVCWIVVNDVTCFPTNLSLMAHEEILKCQQIACAQVFAVHDFGPCSECL